MIEIRLIEVNGFGAAIRGMRNPMNSWENADSFYGVGEDPKEDINHNDSLEFRLGPNDHDLAMRLARKGRDHAKFRRMIHVQMDVVAPLYWWKEFDTYKVGTVENSCSTMHKIQDKEFTLDDFSHDHLVVAGVNSLKRTIEDLNCCREGYLNEDIAKNQDWKKEVWWQMIQLLPSSYNQLRTVDMNYEVLANIYAARKNHKLDEWREFCRWIETLPYSELITGKE